MDCGVNAVPLELATVPNEYLYNRSGKSIWWSKSLGRTICPTLNTNLIEASSMEKAKANRSKVTHPSQLGLRPSFFPDID
jgi:hypothetical protein